MLDLNKVRRSIISNNTINENAKYHGITLCSKNLFVICLWVRCFFLL